MPSPPRVGADLLLTVVSVEVVAICVVFAAFLAHSIYIDRRRLRFEALVDGAAQALQEAVNEPGERIGVLGPVIAMRRRAQIAALLAIAPNIKGIHRRRLTAFALEMGVLDTADKWCRSRSWFKRLKGARLFTYLGGGVSVVTSLLDDGHVDVRAQAIEWVGENPRPELIIRLIDMLGSDLAVRFATMEALIKIGGPALPPLSEHLIASSGAALSDGLKVAVALADSMMLFPALKLSESEDPEVRALATELAGRIGGEDATDRLMGLLRDDSPGTRAAAARALGRLQHWPAAPVLAELLGDSSWDVRQQVACALRQLGSPGELFLRRSLTSGDRFAADMARQTLDLPSDSLSS